MAILRTGIISMETGKTMDMDHIGEKSRMVNYENVCSFYVFVWFNGINNKIKSNFVTQLIFV